MGGRFQLDGQTYTKSGPMMAVSASGESRVVPRYVVLQAVPDGNQAAQAEVPASRDRVHTAFDEFFATCRNLVPLSDQEALLAARERFLKQLE